MVSPMQSTAMSSVDWAGVKSFGGLLDPAADAVALGGHRGWVPLLAAQLPAKPEEAIPAKLPSACRWTSPC